MRTNQRINVSQVRIAIFNLPARIVSVVAALRLPLSSAPQTSAMQAPNHILLLLTQ
jgi:hypothetical protein